MFLTDDVLLQYKRCPRRPYLDRHLDPNQRDTERDFLIKLRREGDELIGAILPSFDYVTVTGQGLHHLPQRRQQTLDLMAQGVPAIYRGVLSLPYQYLQTSSASLPPMAGDLTCVGEPTLLIKRPGRSRWGDWLYLPLNVKLGRRPKPEYKLIAAYHSQMLSLIQAAAPPMAQLMLRDRCTYRINLDHWLPRVTEILGPCLTSLLQPEPPPLFISRQICYLCHWYSRCHDQAVADRHLSLVPGITPSRFQALQQTGITGLGDLAQLTSDRLGEILGEKTEGHLIRDLHAQALSLWDGQPRAKQGQKPGMLKPLQPQVVEFYFDIEAEPDREVDYLLGVLRIAQGGEGQAPQETFYPLLAKTLETEGEVWHAFVELMLTAPEAPIYHFSEYETEAIRRLGQRYSTPKAVIQNLVDRCVDLHRLLVNRVILPVENYSLKSLAQWLGFRWREEGVRGDQTVCWYDQWLHQGDRDALDRIVRYNEDDCRATWTVKQWLWKFGNASSS